MSQEIITEIEKETGFVAINRSDLPNTTEKDEYISFATSNLSKFIHVSYVDRINFLKKNNYELTFENLIDPSLSTRIKS